MKRLRLLLLFALFLTLAPVSAFAATAGAERVADPSSASTWRDWVENSTENVGRIWTDKTVSDGDIELTGADGPMTIEKGNDSDFLTSLSAISSTSNLTMTSSTPLDIVLVLDASGSMDDPMGGRGSTKRIDALKAAANAFVDEIAKANKGISDASQQHRVAVVKFAGNSTNNIGNESYTSGGYTYNYSQRMLGLTACTQDGKGTITSRINAIKPAGATRADEGMNQAKTALKDPRPGAKRVVVFFTDGTPTMNSEFSSSVANSAVSTAKALKDGGTTIYTVGIQNGANPSADPNGWNATNENKFLHALSSNYPAATKYNELGARAADSDFYKTATSADDLKDVFSGISQDIVSAAGHPTDVVEGAENTSGYVTFTDQLGDYMKVDSFKSVVFAKKTFSNPVKSTSGNVDTYTFHGMAGNVLYPAGDLKDIIIRVERSDDARTGDKVTVSIPASLIPLRHFNVDEDEGTGGVTLTFPIRVFYGSSLKKEAIDLLANPDKAMADYIASHTDGERKVYFLANAYSDGVDGDTTSSFTPATGNSYYYFTEDTPLYIDAECTQRAHGPLSGSATYYYKRSWYDIADGKATKSSSVVSFPGSVAEGVTGAIATDESGYLILKKGSRRLTYINELKTSKGANATNTASTIINPHWNGTTIDVALGSNGRISLERPGTLAISKTVAVPAGFDENYYSNLDFTFNISISGAAGKTFKATVKGEDGKTHGDPSWDLTFDAHGNATHTLKHGETLYVYGLPRGTTYTVTEKAANGFETSPAATQGGTIEAGLEAKAEFTNTYSATGTLSGEDTLVGEKILDGRVWLASDKFVVVLRGIDDAPMPEAGENGECRLEITQPEGTSQGTPVPFNFGDITYTAPGTYVYQIYEPADAAEIPGVTNSRALYTVTVMVTDNHDGTLATTASITPVHDDQGGDVETGGESVPAARFTNVFDAAEETWAPRATKTLSDASDALGLDPSMFEFTLTPIDGAPMPDGATSLTGYNDAHGDVDFEGITFKGSDVGKTYRYRIVENMPANPRQGMTYDTTEWIATVVVTSEVENDESIVKVEASYARKDTAETRSSASFENSYTPVPLLMSGAIKGEKRLVGRDLLGTDDFTFAAALVSGPDGGCASTPSFTYARADHRVTFESGELTFTKPGSYVFEIHENAPAADGAGLVWDRHTSTATVRVVDDNGTLRLESVTYDNAAAPDDDDKAQTAYAAFTNRYAPTEVSYYPGLTVRKVLNGRTMQIGEFSFTITGKDADAEPGTSPTTAAEANALLSSEDKSFSNTQRRASGIAEDMAKLTDVTFGAANANKTYAFEVAETRPATGGLPGVTYDKKVHEVVVSVVDNLDGTLSVSTKIDGDAVDGDERVVSFENSYRAQDADFATADLGITKKLEGREWAAGDSFEFKLEASSGAPLPTDEAGNPVTSIQVGPDDVSDSLADINFGTITFSSAGQYTYKVYEVAGSAGGMTYSENVATFHINVRDDVEDGKLVATCTLVSGVREFVNRYDSSIPTDKLVEPHFTKLLKGRDWRDGDAFTFEIVAKTDGAPLPVDASGNVVTTVTVRSAAEAADFTFGTIPFTYDMVRDGARDFTYEISELASNIAGVTDDPRVATLIVHVSDDGAGMMSANVTNENNTFTNTYHSQLDYTAAGGLSVTKTMSGRAMSAGEFGFDVTATGDGDKLGIAGHHTNDEASDGAETLVVSSPARVTFTQEDVGKTYSYTITESGGSLGGVTYDATSYNVTITTADDPSTAKLTVTTHVTSTSGTDETYTYVAGTDANAAAKVSFENSYEARGSTDPITGTKTMANGLMLDGDFSFRLAYAADKNDVVATATNQDRQVKFGTLSYDSAMLATLVSEGKATRTDDAWTIIPYVAYEVTDGLADRGVTPSLDSFRLRVKVRDNGKGKLECALELPAGGLAFSNTYATGNPVSVSLAGAKILSVHEHLAGTDITGKFEFTVTTDEPGAPMPEHTTASNDATGNVNFGSITFTLPDLLRALGEDGGAETGAEAGALAEQREENPTAATTAPNAEANADAAPVPDGSSAAGDVAVTLAPEASADAPGAASAPAADPTPTAPAAPAESESDSDTASDDAAEAQIETLALHSPDEAQVAVAAWRTSRQTLRTVSDVALSATDAPTRERTHTFHYVVSESGSVAGVTNDATPSRDVYIKVTDDGNGKLTAQRVDANGNAVDGPAFSFTNRYSVVPKTSSVTDQITVHKTLTGRALMADEFTFELVEDGRVVATGTNNADGSVSLGTITYTEPGTHIYTIRERGHGTIANGVTYSNASYQVKTVVSDNHDGTLAVEHSLMADADVAEFENTYEAKPTTLALSATKILDGATLEAGQFTFRLTGGGIDLTATNDATGQVTFREMLLSKAGTYTFTISEVNDGQDNVTYDTATHKVTVTVKDDGQGSLVASVSREDLAGCTFRNTYTPPATPTPEPSTPKTPEAPKPTKVVPQTGDTFDVTPIAVAATIGVVLIALAVVLRKRS